jgi:ABC-type nitrate/sulfonate/bicarbonate transport system substrate-binding protein
MNKALIVGAGVAIAALAAGMIAINRSGERSATPSKSETAVLLVEGPLGPQYGGEIFAMHAQPSGRSQMRFELKPLPPGSDVIQAVVGGKGDFGLATGIEFLTAASKGAPIVAIGAGLLESPVAFYVLENSKIHTPRDFIGKRVGRQAGNDTAIIYDAVLENLGLSRSQVQEVPVEDDVNALVGGKVDVLPGYVGNEGYLLRQKGVAYNMIVPADYGIHVPGTVYFARAETLRERPSTAQEFLGAAIAGWNAVYSDYSKSIPSIATATGISPDRVRFAVDAQRDRVRPVARRVGEFDEFQWKQLRIILLNERMIRETANMPNAVDYSFLREAYRKPISFGN